VSAPIRREDGQELVEYALVLPILLLLVLGLMQVGVLLYQYNTLANAAREGARYAVTHPGDSGGINSAARGLTSGLDQASLHVGTTAVGTTAVRVDVTYDVHLAGGMLIGALGGNPELQMNASATVQIE
jgi:Flp pilus assembly protein TadG